MVPEASGFSAMVPAPAAPTDLAVTAAPAYSTLVAGAAEIVFLAVEAGDVLTVAERCSPEVESALPEVVRQAMGQLAAWGDVPEAGCTKPGSPSTL